MPKVDAAALDALNTAAQTHFQNGFAGVKPQYERIATVVPSSSSSNTYAWLGDIPGMREWINDREIKALAKKGYQITNRSFEATVGVKRTDIEDDNLGIYKPLFEGLGTAARLHPDELTFSLLKSGATVECYDGQNYFDTEHQIKDGVLASNYQTGSVTKPMWVLLDVSRPLKPMIYQNRKEAKMVSLTSETDSNVFMKNQYLYGVDSRGDAGFGFWQMAHASTVELTADNYDKNRTSMASLKNSVDKPLGLRPNMILVPPALRSTAVALFKTTNLANGATNPYYGDVEVLECDWLA